MNDNQIPSKYRVRFSINPWIKYPIIIATAMIATAWLLQVGVMAGSSPLWICAPLLCLVPIKLMYMRKEKLMNNDPLVQMQIRLARLRQLM